MQPVTNPAAPPFVDDDQYPTSDGQPMAETELHADEITELKLVLRRYFRHRAHEVYVGSNLFVYYEQGNPRAVFSPDVFVVWGAPQLQYDTYRLWRDGPAPSFVIEVTSKSTRLEDKGNKKAVCEMLGVQEYFLYDPRAEYLDPPLQGFRRAGRQYEPILANSSGRLPAETLDLEFSLNQAGLIVIHDRCSGQRLLRVDEERSALEQRSRQAEAERQRAEAERRRAEAERQREQAERRTVELRAHEAERRLAEALAELQRLKRT